jgi:hypothetical protein
MEESAREDFAIRSSLLRMEFEVMLEKTKKLEEMIRNNMNPQGYVYNSCDTLDVYSPDVETKMQEPPRKRMKR